MGDKSRKEVHKKALQKRIKDDAAVHEKQAMTEDQHHPTSGHTATPGHPTTSDERDPPRPQTDQPSGKNERRMDRPKKWRIIKSRQRSLDPWYYRNERKKNRRNGNLFRTHALVLDPDDGRLSCSVHPIAVQDGDRRWPPRRPRELLKQEARDLILFSVSPGPHRRISYSNICEVDEKRLRELGPATDLNRVGSVEIYFYSSWMMRDLRGAAPSGRCTLD
jgi:hypothetical protein